MAEAYDRPVMRVLRIAIALRLPSVAHGAPSIAWIDGLIPLGASIASIEHCEGKLPVKWLVSTFTPWTMPRMPSSTMHQSWPGTRRRRDSQPSIHLPRVVYLSGMKTAGPALTRFDFGAKKSSLAAIARPPTRADARSARLVNSGAVAI